MKIEEIIDNIFHVTLPFEELARTFIRFQEHYESPEFKGKIFFLEDYEKWYAEKYGEFTYYDDYNGFNIPSYVLKPFIDGKFDPLSGHEKRLLDYFRFKEGNFYIIGSDGILKTRRHEIAHGLFYLNEAYREKVIKILEGINGYDQHKINNFLEDVGYHIDVWIDETHAYLLSAEDIEELYLPDVAEVSKKLKEVFDEFTSKCKFAAHKK